MKVKLQPTLKISRNETLNGALKGPSIDPLKDPDRGTPIDPLKETKN